MFFKREARRKYCCFDCVFLYKWTLTISILGELLPTLGVHLNKMNHRKREPQAQSHRSQSDTSSVQSNQQRWVI